MSLTITSIEADSNHGGKRDRSDGWSDRELQVLYDNFHDSDYLMSCVPLLPLRSKSAIYTKMFRLRLEADELRFVGMGKAA